MALSHHGPHPEVQKTGWGTDFLPVILPHLCKVIGAIALARLDWVARASGFLADQKTEFWRRRSTAHSIADVVST